MKRFIKLNQYKLQDLNLLKLDTKFSMNSYSKKIFYSYLRKAYGNLFGSSRSLDLNNCKIESDAFGKFVSIPIKNKDYIITPALRTNMFYYIKMVK